MKEAFEWLGWAAALGVVIFTMLWLLFIGIDKHMMGKKSGGKEHYASFEPIDMTYVAKKGAMKLCQGDER